MVLGGLAVAFALVPAYEELHDALLEEMYWMWGGERRMVAYAVVFEQRLAGLEAPLCVDVAAEEPEHEEEE